MQRAKTPGVSVRRSLVLMFAAFVAATFAAAGVRTARADGTFSLSASAYSVNEGDAVTITINRTGGTANTQVTITIADGSAVSGIDYVNPGAASFIFTVPGSNSRTLVISTIEDTTANVPANRTFSVTISVPPGSSVGTASATVTIVDDDGQPKYSFQTASSSVNEGGDTGTQTVNVAVVREGSTSGTDSVTCQLDSPPGTATGGGTDYTFSNQTITFNPGETGPKNCTVTIVRDNLTESNETIILKLTGPSGFGGGAGTYTTHTLTIVDDDGPGTVQFSQATYTASEGVGTASIAVTRTGGDSGAASVQCSTTTAGSATAGADYTAVTSQTLTWGNGDSATKFCTVTILQDTLVEGPETVQLQLGGATGATLGTQSTATLTITDDDGTGTIQFTSATFSGTEAGGAITITVARTGGSTGAVTVDYASVAGGTATAGVDYTAVSGTLSWANGELGNKSFTVTPIPDTVTEGSETVVLQLSNVTGGASLGSPSTATVTISDSTIVPVITAISPGAGPTSGGTTVTITGQNFTGATSVTFGGFPCTAVTVVSATTITCVTPPHPVGVVEVVVTTPVGSNATTGTANDFIYTSGPTVTSLSPTEGTCNGTVVVTITGTGFTSTGTSVVFGTVSATFVFMSATELRAVAPTQAAGVVDVRVTTPAGTSPNTVADNFTCIGTPVPTVTSVSPTSGSVGTTVTINGTNFTGVTAVTFGTVSATFTVVSTTQITATVPAGVGAGVVDIRVTNTAGTSANTSADNFTVTSTGTITYTLYRSFTLIVWTGADNKPISQAIGGTQAGTDDVSSQIGAIWLWDPETQSWDGYFPGTEHLPGANDFTTFRTGVAYFIALRTGTSPTVTWRAPAN